MSDGVDPVTQLLLQLNRAVAAGEAESPEKERARYIWLLSHIANFIKTIGGTIALRRYFLDLAEALSDLDHGVTSPMLRPTNFGSGRRGDTSRMWEARARVAVGIEALVKAGMTRADAAKASLNDFPEIKRLMTRRSDAPVKAVLSWHEEFKRAPSRRRNKSSKWVQAIAVNSEFLQAAAGHPRILKRLARSLFLLAARI
jgi:hypothetical protein